MQLTSNLRIIRKKKNLTQDMVADAIGITRSKYKNYESALDVRPDYETLIKLSEYFRISTDFLLKMDLSKLTEFQWGELERGFEIKISGSQLRILATSVDNSGKENITLVNQKAMAGYTAGYNDSEYISALPTFQLPFLASERTHRAFPIEGDSMLPIPSGSIVIAEYVENWKEIKDGHAYIIITENEGIVFKVVYNQVRIKKNLLLKSLNTLYKPYEVNLSEVKEVWKFVNYLSNELPEAPHPFEQLAEIVLKLHEEVKELKKI